MTIAIKPTASGSTIEQDGSTVLSIESDKSVDVDSGTLHVDATNNRVGVGTSSPTYPLTVSTSSGAVGVKIISTSAGTLGPDLSLQHDSASPADNDIISLISFQGNDSGGTNTTYSQIRCIANDVTDTTEDGSIAILTTSAGSLAERMRIDSSGNVGIGTSSPDLDFEVANTIGTIYFTLADNAVATIPAPKNMGFLSISTNPKTNTPPQDGLGLIAYDCGTSKQIQFVVNSYTGGQGTLATGGIQLYNLTNLTGSTGTDGKVNVSCFTDFNIQVENRKGFTSTFALTFI